MASDQEEPKRTVRTQYLAKGTAQSLLSADLPMRILSEPLGLWRRSLVDPTHGILIQPGLGGAEKPILLTCSLVAPMPQV